MFFYLGSVNQRSMLGAVQTPQTPMLNKCLVNFGLVASDKLVLPTSGEAAEGLDMASSYRFPPTFFLFGPHVVITIAANAITDLRSLVDTMLQRNPRNRPSASSSLAVFLTQFFPPKQKARVWLQISQSLVPTEVAPNKVAKHSAVCLSKSKVRIFFKSL